MSLFFVFPLVVFFIFVLFPIQHFSAAQKSSQFQKVSYIHTRKSDLHWIVCRMTTTWYVTWLPSVIHLSMGFISGIFALFKNSCNCRWSVKVSKLKTNSIMRYNVGKKNFQRKWVKEKRKEVAEERYWEWKQKKIKKVNREKITHTKSDREREDKRAKEKCWRLEKKNMRNCKNKTVFDL